MSNPTGEMSETSDRSDNWPHLKYDFLRKGQVCDAKRRKENDPDYDPKTLWVPEQFLNKQTPVCFTLMLLKFALFLPVTYFFLNNRLYDSGGTLKEPIMTQCYSSNLANFMSYITWMLLLRQKNANFCT